MPPDALHRHEREAKPASLRREPALSGSGKSGRCGNDTPRAGAESGEGAEKLLHERSGSRRATLAVLDIDRHREITLDRDHPGVSLEGSTLTELGRARLGEHRLTGHVLEEARATLRDHATHEGLEGGGLGCGEWLR